MIHVLKHVGAGIGALLAFALVYSLASKSRRWPPRQRPPYSR